MMESIFHYDLTEKFLNVQNSVIQCTLHCGNYGNSVSHLTKIS